MRSIRNYFVADNAVVTGNVNIAGDVNIWYFCLIRGDIATITIGPRVNLQDGCIVHTDQDAPQTIEEGVVAGHSAILHGASVGRDTLVGIGARLLSGTVIGEECLIAAGSLVTERTVIPPRSVVMGSPAKVVRSIKPEEIERTRSINSRYLELAKRYVRGDFPPPWNHS